MESAERSGNKYVNRIYEGNLREMDATSAIMLKPIAGAHEASRQRFVKEKYLQQTYYSKAAHFQHVAQCKVEPSTPSKSRRSSLMVFLKNKDSPSGDKIATFAKGEEGTLSTSPSSQQDVKIMHPFPTSIPFDASPVKNNRRSIDPLMTSSSLARNSMSPLISSLPKDTSIAGTSPGAGGDLATSQRESIKNSPLSSESSERRDRKTVKRNVADRMDRNTDSDIRQKSERLDRKSAPSSRENSIDKSLVLKPSKKVEDYRDPRRATFHESKNSVDFSILDDNDDDTKVTAPIGMVGIETPRTTKPVLVATKSLPSPANSRMSLYSSKTSTSLGGRGRSSSRSRQGEEGTRERSSLRTHKIDRGRSMSVKHRDNSPGKTRKERLSSSQLRTKQSSSTMDSPSRKRSSPKKLRTDRVSSSPLRIHRNVSGSLPRADAINESRRRSSSARPRTEGLGTSHRPTSSAGARQESKDESRRRSTSARPRTEGIEGSRRRSSGARPQQSNGTQKSSSQRIPSTSRLATEETKDRSSRARSRSSSKRRTRGTSMDDSKSLLLRERGTQRAARERSRSKSRTMDVLGELKKATTRRTSRSSDRSVISESSQSRGMASWQESKNSNSSGLLESEPKKEKVRQEGRRSLASLMAQQSEPNDALNTREKQTSRRQNRSSTITVMSEPFAREKGSTSQNLDFSMTSESKQPISRRKTRSSNISVMSEPSARETETTRSRGSRNSRPITNAFEQSKKKNMDSAVVGTLEGDFPLNDGEEFHLENDAPDEDSVVDKVDSHASLSLESACSDEKGSVTTPSGYKKKNFLKEGEESFQVISATGHSYNFGITSKKTHPKEKALGRSCNDPIGEFNNSFRVVRGGDDKFEKSKLRLSRGKAAEKIAARSSRKNDIFAALDQKEEEVAGPLMRVAPLRCKSTDGVVRPLLRHGAPLKRRSDTATITITKRSSNLPVEESARRADFNQGCNVTESIELPVP